MFTCWLFVVPKILVDINVLLYSDRVYTTSDRTEISTREKIGRTAQGSSGLEDNEVVSEI